jgi:F-type H+-transporting ATPase subunit b
MMGDHKESARRSALLLVFTLAFALPALAAVEGEGESNLFAGDLGNAIWTIVVFLALVFVLGKFAWGPILDNLQKREDFIRGSLEEAKKAREQSEARLKEYEERLKEARAEATAIAEEGRRDAEVLRQRIEQEAREEGEKIRRRTLRDLDIAKETAVKELYELSGTLATHIASQIIRRELKAEDHQKLIEDAISEMERLETN